MNDETISTSSRPRTGRGAFLWLLVLIALAVVATLGWRAWKARDAQAQAKAADEAQHLAALDQRLESVRRDQRTLTQRVQDAAATNRILRDEVLGLGQRGALLEESVAKLADPSRHGAQALRLDEVEMLLSLAGQRMSVADDLDGARRAYALAAGALEGIDDHRLLNLKQTLTQERQALDALGVGQRARLSQQLDAFAGGLAGWPQRPAAAGASEQSRWQRWLAPLVDVRPSRQAAFVAPSDRNAGEAALRIEISLAHAALERGDAAGFQSSLNRIDQWLTRLWPDSPALRQGRQQIAAMRSLPLRADNPLLGSTLEQLRSLRNAGFTAPAAPRPEATP
ncbi:uroporphyrinogen-III C-methyltransferase [Pseudoxanthomonas sp.]|uniref:uroporphyrinogen-III C-methyltransferase n=1 Tax=Pseudoxanthomonas sp. TaxID=1871049 RepID=UPI003F7DA3F1